MYQNLTKKIYLRNAETVINMIPAEVVVDLEGNPLDKNKILTRIIHKDTVVPFLLY